MAREWKAKLQQSTGQAITQEHDAEVWKFLNEYAAYLRQSGDEWGRKCLIPA